MGELGGELASVSSTKLNFECPLCTDIFMQFSQLKTHLLSMHPRREMIMKLVTERYEISKKDSEIPTVGTCHSQDEQESSTCCEQMSKKLQPAVLGMETSTQVFKVPKKLHHKPAALPRSINDPHATGCEELESMKMSSASEESSSWKSYLSFCSSYGVSKDPVHGDQ